ncbi:MAG: hypothetical protein ACO1O1_13450 [Adhaeribacter sp.]
MKTRNLLALFFAALTFAFSACDDQNTPDPAAPAAPAQEQTLTRSFTYPDDARLEAAYEADTIKVQVSYTEKEFHFYTGVKPVNGKSAVGNDHVNFVVAAGQLKQGLVGSYSLKSFTSPQTGEAKVSFIHYTSESGGNIFDSQFNTLTGSFEITAYDARHKLISGHYTLGIQEASDPYERLNPRKINIVLSGTFKNVPVKDQL